MYITFFEVLKFTLFNERQKILGILAFQKNGTNQETNQVQNGTYRQHYLEFITITLSKDMSKYIRYSRTNVND